MTAFFPHTLAALRAELAATEHELRQAAPHVGTDYWSALVRYEAALRDRIEELEQE